MHENPQFVVRQCRRLAVFLVMQEIVVQALRAQRAPIHAHWETLLRTERVTSPMANPDTLVYLINTTLDDVFSALLRDAPRQRSARAAVACPCGRNPLLAYFMAGEQVLVEALVLIQSVTPALKPVERDSAMAELRAVMRTISGREIEAFCAVCQYRQEGGADKAACAAMASLPRGASAHARPISS